jgi:hypothetical protein
MLKPWHVPVLHDHLQGPRQQVRHCQRLLTGCSFLFSRNPSEYTIMESQSPYCPTAFATSEPFPFANTSIRFFSQLVSSDLLFFKTKTLIPVPFDCITNAYSLIQCITTMSMRWMIFITNLILPATIGPGVFSASNRNECQKKTNSVALVRKRTIPTDRPPLVGEI